MLSVKVVSCISKKGRRSGKYTKKYLLSNCGHIIKVSFGEREK